MSPEARSWQQNAHAALNIRWLESVSYRALIAACPGAGKTRFGVTVTLDLLRAEACEVGLVIVPTVVVQMEWVNEFKDAGIKADVTLNDHLRWRRDAGTNHTMIEDKQAIVVTYAQLAMDPALFAEFVRRHKTFVIADEIHHADDDEAYGKAINQLLGDRVRSLALSGTPFNTAGGALALCETRVVIDQDTGKPMRETVPTYSYSYAQAIDDGVCRPVNFNKVSGHGRATYRSLLNNELFEKLISTARKSDRIGLLLYPDGEFMQECIRQGLDALATMREAGDRRAGMLIVARDTKHGHHLRQVIDHIKNEKQEWHRFTIKEIYHDTAGAHDQIDALKTDDTDIVISVRMISEGVNIKRLRVGIYATDWMTRMFFIQFIGRFIRNETRAPLDRHQHAVIVIPAHPDLLLWAREIEKQILAGQVKLDGVGGGNEKKSEFLDAEIEAGDVSLTYRGEEVDYDENLLDEMYQKSPTLREVAPATVIKIGRDLFGYGSTANTRQAPPINWSQRNDRLVAQIVRFMQADPNEDDGSLFRRVNGAANKDVGIKRKDSMTAEETLIRRWHFLQAWYLRILNEHNWSTDSPS